MTADEFHASVHAATLPPAMPPLLEALWHDAHGDWHSAHAIAQRLDDDDAAWLHAYLHRKEGDAGNAAYWYRRAARAPASCTLAAEWQQLAAAFTTARPAVG